MRATWLVSIATAFALLGASILPFLTPAWVGYEQGRSGAAALTGFDAADLDAATSGILGQLVLGGDFDVRLPDRGSVLTEAERQHMRDVRGVFDGLYVLVLASIAGLALAWRGARERDSRAAWWRGVRRGAAGLAVLVAVLGAISLVAFDAAFEVFHRLFFATGTYLFDPASSRLVQLFPDQFWSETTIVLGVVTVALSVGVAWIARRREGAGAAAAPATAPGATLRVGEVRR